MRKIEKHGLKMIGLKKASGNTANWGYSGWCTDIFYNRSDGTIMTRDNTENDWCEFGDKDIVCVARTTEHVTMQYIADAIHNTLDELEKEENMRRLMREAQNASC